MCDFKTNLIYLRYTPEAGGSHQNSQSVSYKVVSDGQQLGVADAGAGAHSGVRQVASFASQRGGAHGRLATPTRHYLAGRRQEDQSVSISTII